MKNAFRGSDTSSFCIWLSSTCGMWHVAMAPTNGELTRSRKRNKAQAKQSPSDRNSRISSSSGSSIIHHCAWVNQKTSRRMNEHKSSRRRNTSSGQRKKTVHVPNGNSKKVWTDAEMSKKHGIYFIRVFCCFRRYLSAVPSSHFHLNEKSIIYFFFGSQVGDKVHKWWVSSALLSVHSMKSLVSPF